jgi:hypothetical protein
VVNVNKRVFVIEKSKEYAMHLKLIYVRKEQSEFQEERSS